MLTRYKGQLKLKDWAFAIARRSTMRKARVALARRLAIIMHGRADERLRDLGIPASHDRTLAWCADAPQPATSIDVDPDEDDRRPVLANPSHPASVAREAVPRHHPRWEPGALAAPAGICAGGGE